MNIKRLSILLAAVGFAATAHAAGLGTATVFPTTVGEGSILTTTITYIVPAGGMVSGSSVEVDLPQGWGPYLNANPGQNGYTTVFSSQGSPGVTFSTTSAAATIVFTSTAGPGTNIRFLFQGVYVGCPGLNQTAAAWTVKSSTGVITLLSPIAVSPVSTIAPGTFQWLGYNPWTTLNAVRNGPAIGPLTLQANDGCGQPVPVISSLTVTLSALMPNQSTPDTSASFSASSSSIVSISSVTILNGTSSASFYYLTTAASVNNYWIRGDYLQPGNSTAFQIWRSVNVLASAPTLAAVSVDNGALVAGQKSAIISPDGSGTNNLATIRFLPSDLTQSWHVSISTNNFATTLYDRWGQGDPQSTVNWDGRIQPAGIVAPNATYAVKIDYAGITSDTSLSIIVHTAFISGTVSVQGSPVAGAQVIAQGQGYSATTTDASGNYILYGLRAGLPYNLNATYINPVNQSVATQQLPNVTAPATQNFSLSAPSIIRVSANASNPAPAVIFGSLNMHSSDYLQNYFGNLRLVAGSTQTDNGDTFNPSTWTVFYVQPGSYVIHLNMQGFGANDVTVNATGNADVLIPLTQRANVYGTITLPNPAPYALWASVTGTPVGSNQPTAWGGASFNAGQTTAVYSMFAVNPGTYTLVAQMSGYAPSTKTQIVGSVDLGNSISGGIDFPVLGVGSVITGQLTINGDISGLQSPLNLWVNAYSPTLGFNVSTQVQLTTTSALSNQQTYQLGGLADSTYQIYAPYLAGFDPSTFGPQTVTVSGGAGTMNFTLTQETGRINAAVTLPGAASDYSNVHLSIQGPINIESDLTAATTSILHLGTGFYNLTAIYKTSGAQFQTTVNLTNGQILAVPIDLRAPTFTASGNVSVQSGFSMKGSTGTLVTINTVSDLLANATNQNLYIGGMPAPGGILTCANTAPLSTTTARVEAFPKSFNSFGDTNRTGFNNCFRVGQYKFGVIQADGSYSIPNLSPGVWEIDVYPYFDNGQTPNAASQQQFITVTSGPMPGVNFALTGGNSVSGTISLSTGVVDSRQLSAQILDNRGNSIQSATLLMGAAAIPVASVDYKFTNLAAGQYSLLLQDQGGFDGTLSVKYVASPVQFTINNSDLTGINVTLGRAAHIIGTLGIQTVNANGVTSLTLITPTNTSLLPANFQIMAQANPSIPGGSYSATFSNGGSGPMIDANNHFSIDGLNPGTYDVNFQQSSFGISVQAAGGINVASYTQGSVSITQGQTVDLGVITLKPGLSLSGTVKDSSGNPLSNITIRATPSSTQHGQDSIQVTSDAQGNFTLTGLSADLKVYDIVAAPRPDAGSSDPLVAFGQVKRLAVDVTQVPAPTLNFTLASATAQLTGVVQTVDHGTLSYPDSDQVGYPAAAIFFHLQGTSTDDNPLGQESATGLDGSFTVGNLAAGVYDLTIESLGYKPFRITGVTLTSGGSQDLGTVTLQKGPEVDATLAKPDGSAVNTGEVGTVVGVTSDLTSIIFGQVTKDANTGNILSIKFSGFELAPKVYNLLLFDKQNNITTPPEGKNLTFTSNTDVISLALTYQPSAPFAYTDVKRSTSTAMSITYYFSRPLRNRGDDQDPSQWLTITSGHGALYGYALTGDRRNLTVLYSPAAGEQNATIAFSAHSVDIDPTTGVEFSLTKTITVLLGQKATSESNINPALGGSVSLATSNDASNVSIPSNALLSSNGSQADASTSYNVTFTATDDVASVVTGNAQGSRALALDHLMTRGAAAYVSEAYMAMQNARANTTVNPFSSFYSVLLPAGISHTLNQNATLTLTYDPEVDPTTLNVYYFNGIQYLIENGNRTVDPVNHTISVNVSHFSTFVLLQNDLTVVTVNGDASSDAAVEVMNFPNPFDLQTKTKMLNHGGGTSSITTDGTIIRYLIPAAKAGAAHITIYDVLGEKVRTLDLGTPVVGSYQYITWDGRNNAGRPVASGVYIGVLKAGGEKKTWKMAVIK